MTATAPPRHDEPEALIEEAWQRTRHRQRQRRTATLAALAAAGLVTLAVTNVSGGHDASSSLGRRSGASDAARLAVRYFYTRAVVPSVMEPGQPAPAVTTIENWVGSDGAWRLRETVPGRAPGSLDVAMAGDNMLPPQTNAYGVFDGVPFNPRNPGDGLFTARRLAALPTGPGALTARLWQAVTAQDLRNFVVYLGPRAHSVAQRARLRAVFLARRVSQTLLAIADLDMTPLPQRLTYALSQAARTLPGVHVTSSTHAATQRNLTVSGGGFALTFARRTGALRAASTGAFFDQGSAGTVVARGAVPTLSALPAGVRPIPSLVARPPMITLTPHSATPTAPLTLQIRLAATPTSTNAAPHLFAAMFGPTGPNCTYWMSRPPLARVAPGTTARSGRDLIASYRITPATIGRQAWCAGRYQLMLSPILAAEHGSTVPRSFVAAYFTIHS